MTELQALSSRWREEAALLARYGDEKGSLICHVHADQLDAAVCDANADLLTLSQAALESGYSRSRLRHLVSDGKLPNSGRKGNPRIRRGDLPRKPRSDTNAFDAIEAAHSVLGG